MDRVEVAKGLSLLKIYAERSFSSRRRRAKPEVSGIVKRSIKIDEIFLDIWEY